MLWEHIFMSCYMCLSLLIRTLMVIMLSLQSAAQQTQRHQRCSPHTLARFSQWDSKDSCLPAACNARGPAPSANPGFNCSSLAHPTHAP